MTLRLRLAVALVLLSTVITAVMYKWQGDKGLFLAPIVAGIPLPLALRFFGRSNP